MFSKPSVVSNKSLLLANYQKKVFPSVCSAATVPFKLLLTT